MKKFTPYLYPILTGMLILAFMAICFLQITIDFQIILMLGTAIFMGAAYLNSSLASPLIFKVLAINLPFSWVFYSLVLAQIPNLWYFLVLFLLASILGCYLRRPFKKRLLLSASFFFILCLLISWKFVPQDISKNLGTSLNETLGAFSLSSMEGNQTLSSELNGQVVVLDFFATWCKPCILELKELEKIKGHFTENEVKFYVVNSEIGGDTKEKMQAYIDRTNYTFNYVFDAGSKLYQFFGFEGLGVPVLLVLDKKGKLRFKHWGFNKGEAYFEQQMVTLIEDLLAE